MLQESVDPRTIFKGIVEDSLRAFPDDAHQKVLQYLLESGVDEAQSLKFRQSWSKVVLGSQAFGRGAKSKVDPALFSEELIRELSYSDEHVTRLINATASCMKLDNRRNSSSSQADTKSAAVEFKNPRDTIAALEAVTGMEASLTNVLSNIYLTAENKGSSSTGNDENISDSNTALLESIGLFRKSLRGTRLHWGGHLLPADVLYLPLDSVIHGLPDITKGKLDMQLRTDRQDLNVYMQTDEIIGVVVSNKQCVHQERGWNAYLSLNELLSSHGLNLFPLPVGVHREPTNLSTTFAFESAAGCVALKDMLGPSLSTYLRRIPHVAHRWCAQLAQAHTSLLHCSGSLMKPIRVNTDLFIRENGHLLIGNVAFDATPPGNRAGYGAAFLRVCCEVLQRSLCLSREEGVQLGDEGSYLVDTLGAEDDELSGEGRAVLDGAMEDLVLAVVVGSTLDLAVTGHACTAVSVVDGRAVLRGGADGASDGPGAARRGQRASNSAAAPAAAATTSGAGSEVSASTLLVNAAVSDGAYSDYAHITAVPSSASSTSSGKSGGSLGLTIRTMKAGVMSLHLSARGLQSDDGRSEVGSGRVRRLGRRVRLVIIPNYAVESVLLQELVGHLEEARKWRNPEILLHAQLFQRPQRSEEEERAADAAAAAGKTSSNIAPAGVATAAVAVVVNARDVQRGWQDIKRVITNHGTLHVPK